MVKTETLVSSNGSKKKKKKQKQKNKANLNHVPLICGKLCLQYTDTAHIIFMLLYITSVVIDFRKSWFEF